MSAPTYLVRIKPHVPVDSYNEFKKLKGWHEVSKEKADWCATRTVTPLESAEKVFDVMTKDEAARVHETEQKKIEPAGSPDEPIKLPESEGEKSKDVKAEADKQPPKR